MTADVIDSFARQYEYAKLEIKDVVKKIIAHFVYLFFVFREKGFSNTGKMLHNQLH